MIKGTASTGTVLINGRQLKATAILLQQQDGSAFYSWGMELKESRKLAFAILFELVDGQVALEHHNHFRHKFIEPLKHGQDFELDLSEIHRWFKSLDPDIVMDFGTKPCPKCAASMTYQSSLWKYDPMGWRCSLCGSYDWPSIPEVAATKSESTANQTPPPKPPTYASRHFPWKDKAVPITPNTAGGTV